MNPFGDEELKRIAQDIGEITEERDTSRDRKVNEEDVEAFDVEEYRRSMEEYDGGWSTGGVEEEVG